MDAPIAGAPQPRSRFPAGALVISLDFELYWGVRDSRLLEEYGENILGARRAIPALLALFRRYRIHATWATVGFLFCRTQEELLAVSPPQRPRYRDARLCPYEATGALGADESADPYHYALSLIEKIREFRSQEIASHTFSHYYCLEPGQDSTSFEADLTAAVEIASRIGIDVRSLVFPRNQVNAAYLETCARYGFTAYRGVTPGWMYSPGGSIVKRLLRLADTYLRLSGDNTVLPEMSHSLVNVPASRFLRPYSGSLAPFDGLRLRRICAGLTAAAKRGRIYHLLWHPHNFGVNLDRNLSFLEAIFRHFDSLRERTGAESLTMAECAARLIPPQVNCDHVPLSSIHA